MNSVTDHETCLVESDHHSLKLWLRLLTCSSLIEKKLRDELRLSFDMTLPRFDFLSQLERAPDGLTMGELSKRMMVSGGNISGIAAQLVDEGLIDRCQVPNNRRTFIVTLTQKGRDEFETIAKTHECWVIEMLGQLDQDDVKQLMNLLLKVKNTVLTDPTF
ncbi:MAG: MarR family transcriptional regulator [Halieaceae bacterium]|nr:MarR family transcriptional regulator [Halieaceae bacterium]